jgi:predicted ribosomally synthesized peptide with SipW-like signal peptide
MTMTDSPSFKLTRRRLLSGIGAVGIASAGAGLGTSAYFSDREAFDTNLLVAGELDLKVDWQETYTGPDGFVYVDAFPDNFVNDPANPDQYVYENGYPKQGADGIQDPIATREELAARPGYPEDPTDPTVEAAFRDQFANVPDYLDQRERPLIDIEDVKPGDSGEVTFSLHMFDNPGYIWLNGRLLANEENSVPEPERKDPDENDDAPVPDDELDDRGELADEIRVTLWYDEDGDNELDDGERVVLGGNEDPTANPTLAEALAILSQGLGVPLDGDRTTDFAEIDEGAPAAGDDPGRECYPNSTTQYVGFAWELPVDHANEIQTDSVTFDLGFYAEQCRHNDGEGMTDDTGLSEVINLSTGHADWQVIQSPDGTTGSAVVTGPHPAWATSECADWIDPYGNDPEASDPTGQYVYQVGFTVETGEVGTLVVQHYGSDNPVEFYLDGTSIGGSGGESAYSALRSDIDAVPGIAPGTHSLRAVVENVSGTGSNPTGLLVCARVE